ncbi:uncharacterized protein LOC111449156 [Cucurbita moschata]|uniref:Uncharacterized protein LOC111449156 n=1 Tax=Cucurbita moschata TaxID=3662 RepID=A0A6J1FZ13_CUCMO|nr:uncharacterized protein LOC111449156 [Cucurbita moschata]
MMDESFTFPSKDFMAKDVELNSLPLQDQLKVDDLFLQDDLQVTQKFTSYCLVFSIVYSVITPPSSNDTLTKRIIDPPITKYLISSPIIHDSEYDASMSSDESEAYLVEI